MKKYKQNVICYSGIQFYLFYLFIKNLYRMVISVYTNLQNI